MTETATHRLTAGEAVWLDGRVIGYKSSCSCGWATPVHRVVFRQGVSVVWREGILVSAGDPFHRSVGEAQGHRDGANP